MIAAVHLPEWKLETENGMGKEWASNISNGEV